MAGGPSLLGISKQRVRTSKRATISNNESSRQSSLLDTDIGMEGWPVTGGSSSSGGISETRQEQNDEATNTKTGMGQLLDVGEDNPQTPEANVEEKEVPRKSLLQQLYELQGLEVDAVTATTTTTTTTITSIKTKPASATTSSEESLKESSQNSQANPQVTTPVTLGVENLSLSEDHEQAKEPVSTNEPIIETSVSNQYTPTTVTNTPVIYTPSTPTIPRPPSPPSPPTALEILRSQELAIETQPPLGTEISAWAAALPSSQDMSEAGNGEGGYIKRFTTRRNPVSDAKPNKDNTEPDKENAMVKWDPFGGLWGYAAGKKVWIVPKKEVVEEEKKKRKESQQAQMELKKAKEENFKLEEDVKQNVEEEEKEDLEKKYACFDELESVWTQRDGKKEKKKEEPTDNNEEEPTDNNVEEHGKKFSYFDELEKFMNS